LYTMVVTLDRQEVPPDLMLDGHAWPDLLVGNASTTPLYVFGPLPPGESAPPDPLPAAPLPDTVPLYKVVANSGFAWSHTQWAPPRPERSTTDPGLYRLYRPLGQGSGDLDPRPWSPPQVVQVPEPEHATIALLYGTQPLIVPVTITYTPNPNYDQE